jgi:hypothetical protein
LPMGAAMRALSRSCMMLLSAVCMTAVAEQQVVLDVSNQPFVTRWPCVLLLLYSCNNCKPGYGGPTCLECEAGNYSAGGPKTTTVCTPCGEGLTTTAARSKSKDDCTGERTVLVTTHGSRHISFVAATDCMATVAALCSLRPLQGDNRPHKTVWQPCSLRIHQVVVCLLQSAVGCTSTAQR